MKNIIRVSVTLFIITLVIGLALSSVNALTKDRIEANNVRKIQASINAFFPNATDVEEVEPNEKALSLGVSNVYLVKEGDEVVGVATQITEGTGFSGDIVMMVGVYNDRTFAGVRLISHAETPGLGAKATEDFYTDQYLGQKSGLKVIKVEPAADGEILSITGATITSVAVTNGVNNAATVANDYLS